MNPSFRLFSLRALFVGVVFVLPSVCSFAAVEPPRLAMIDERVVEHTLHVSSLAAAGGDGSAERPFATVQAAVVSARRLNAPTRIRVASGIYRETIDLAGQAGVAEPLLVIEAERAGEAIISGSDVFTDWRPVASEPGRFEHEWTHAFGWEKNPWPGLMPLEAEGLRSELLFVDGRPLKQVFAEAGLVTGTYWVDEAGDRLVMQLPAGAQAAAHHIEASVRPLARQGAHSKLLRVMERDNVVVRGLVFRHATTRAFAAAVQFLASSNVLLEDVTCEWNAGVGLNFAIFRNGIGSNITVRRARLDNNGFTGFGGSLEDGLIEDVTVDFNNWRGVEVGATGWAPCGWKLSHLNRVVLRRVRTNGNHASGGWLDDVIHHVRIEDYVALNNLRSGLSVEAVEGPLEITGAFLAGNSTGLNLFDSRNMSVTRSIVADNTLAQIRLAGSLPMAAEALAVIKPDWRRNRLAKRQVPTGLEFVGNFIGVTRADLAPDARLVTVGMRENAFAGPDGAPSLDGLFTSLEASGNRYAHPDGRLAQVFPDRMNRAVDLAGWRAETGQDGDAEFDADAVARAVAARAAAAGVEVRPYASPKRELVAPVSGADRLEL